MKYLPPMLLGGLLSLLTPLYGQFPPAQPATGPGGYDYPHASVSVHGPYQPPKHVGDHWYDYYIYEPAEPKPAQAPVVLFVPGYGAWLPQQYWGLITHMARKGYTVVWARADQSLFAVWQFADDAGAAWADALKRLDQDPELVRPLRDEVSRPLTGMMGHSIGGWITPIMASRAGAGKTDYPAPKGIFLSAPGQGLAWPEDLSKMRPETKLVMTIGDRDFISCTGAVSQVWAGTPQIPDANKDFLLIHSEKRGIFDLSSGHEHTTGFIPFGGWVDSVDYYAVFKLAEAVMDCGIYGKNCSYAVGNGAPEQLSMGVWSDGQEAVPMSWYADPSAIPAISGCRQ